MTCHEYSGGSIVEQMENNMWEKSVDTGCMRMIWDPIKKKRKGVHVTNQLAEMFGMTKEVKCDGCVAHEADRCSVLSSSFR